jgi:hypothetical protein
LQRFSFLNSYDHISWILVGIWIVTDLFPNGTSGESRLVIALFRMVQMGIELSWKKEYTNSD